MWDFGWMGWGGGLFMALWAVLLIVLVAWLAHLLTASPRSDAPARRILDERFAAGEISEEEYRTRRRALG